MTEKQQEPIDPLRRIWVPIEKRDVHGNWRFQTTDKQRYLRNAETGTIRRFDPKPLNKKQRRKNVVVQHSAG